MKIGAFSAKYSLIPETVRYYVNEGLLVPRSRNGRYDFGDDDQRDIEFLLQLKSYHFSGRFATVFLYNSKNEKIFRFPLAKPTGMLYNYNRKIENRRNHS